MSQLVIDRTALWEKVGYVPHTRQVLFHDSTARFKVPVCGRRFGKSKMAAMEVLPQLFVKDTMGWIVGPTYTLGAKEFAYIWDAIVNKLKIGGTKGLRKAFNERTGDMFVQMPWGSKVEVKSADHPDGLVGEGLDYIIMSEAAKQRPVVWDKFLRPSLADKAPNSWASFPSTPEGHNWYYTDLYLRGKPNSLVFNPNYESWNFPSWENPYVYPLGFDDPEIQDQNPSEDNPWFWQEIGADFRSFVGKIYTEWDDDDHIMAEYEYNPDWPNYLFFDFGFENPFVALDVQISPSDDIFIWREYYVKQLPVHKHAVELARNRTNPAGYKVLCGYGDSADPEAVEVLSSMLCPVRADGDAKEWVQGIQVVKRFLRDKDGKTHVKVHRHCVNTIFEFQNYRVKQTLKGDENPKEEPKKWADHAMDAFRYGLMHLYVLGARHHLDEVMTRTNPVLDENNVVEEAHSFFTRTNPSDFSLDTIDVW
jgi:hypothetical protein